MNKLSFCNMYSYIFYFVIFFSLLPITQLELVLIHIVPVEYEIKVTSRTNHEVSSLLSCEVHATESGHSQYNKLIQLVYQHYNLTSTTVTGIPMKVSEKFLY